MNTTERGTAHGIHLADPEARRAFGRAKILVVLYGLLSAAALAAVAGVWATGHATTAFEWIRSPLIFASAGIVYWLTAAAARGSRSSYGRLRIIAVVLPVAIIGVDLIPGAAPVWFTLAQAPGALALAGAAFILNGPRLRGAFDARR